MPQGESIDGICVFGGSLWLLEVFFSKQLAVFNSSPFILPVVVSEDNMTTATHKLG